jgi:hypothetical protein
MPLRIQIDHGWARIKTSAKSVKSVVQKFPAQLNRTTSARRRTSELSHAGNRATNYTGSKDQPETRPGVRCQ